MGLARHACGLLRFDLAGSGRLRGGADYLPALLGVLRPQAARRGCKEAGPCPRRAGPHLGFRRDAEERHADACPPVAKKEKGGVEWASMGDAPPSQPPRAGLGKSDGPGTFRSFKQASYPRTVIPGGGVTSMVRPTGTDLHLPKEFYARQRENARARVGGSAGAAANSGQAPLPQQVPPAQHDGSGQEWWPGGWGNGKDGGAMARGGGHDGKREPP